MKRDAMKSDVDAYHAASEKTFVLQLRSRKTKDVFFWSRFSDKFDFCATAHSTKDQLGSERLQKLRDFFNRQLRGCSSVGEGRSCSPLGRPQYGLMHNMRQPKPQIQVHEFCRKRLNGLNV